MAEIKCIVGCSGWSEAQARYVQTFPAIEIQTTFYQPPGNAVAARWKAQAPPQFHFCMKAWQLITHTPASPTYRRLKSGVSPREMDLYGSFRPTEQVHLAWERTREIADVLDAKVIVFQCPKSFLPTRENLRNLTTFFQGIDRSGRLIAWEPRGPDWPAEVIRDVCTRNRLIHCVDPFVSDSVYGDTLYWRLHGRAGYRYRYTDEDLDAIDFKLGLRTQSSGDSYIMFNNISSRQDALRFMERSRFLTS